MRSNKLCELCAQCIPVVFFVLLLHSCHAHILNRTLRANYIFGTTFDLEHYYSESCNLIGQLEVN